MAERPKCELQEQLLAVIESLVKVVAKISAMEDTQGDDVAVPELFLCPLSEVLMKDPVMLSNGQTFERYAIDNWLKSGKMICPKTKEILSHSNLTPNHLVRELIRDWCKKHGKSVLVQYSFLTPSYICREYFASLHMKLSSTRLADQKEASKELRKETTERPYFRKLYVESLDVVPRLLAPLFQHNKDSKTDPQLQEDLITTLMVISAHEKIKKVIAESPTGIHVLIEALESDNVDTQRNAASTIFQLSSLDSNKEIIGKTEAMMRLAMLLLDDAGALLYKDAGVSLFRLSENDENKVRAVKQSLQAVIFDKIEKSECVDVMLPILANLSTVEEGIKEIEKHSCHHLYRVIRESFSSVDKENGIVILSNVLRKDGSKWKDMIRKEEVTYGTILEIAQNGTSRAKRLAKAILEGLNMKIFTSIGTSSPSLNL